MNAKTAILLALVPAFALVSHHGFAVQGLHAAAGDAARIAYQRPQDQHPRQSRPGQDRRQPRGRPQAQRPRNPPGTPRYTHGRAYYWHGTPSYYRGHVYWSNNIRDFHRYGYPVWRGGYWHHGWYGGRWGWWWVVGGIWYYYTAPIYPYPDPYVPGPVVVVQQQSQTPPPPTEAPTQYWYHCSAPEGYYPYVPECPGGWQAVPATPPAPGQPPQ